MTIKNKLKEIIEDGVSVETMMITFLIGVVLMVASVVVSSIMLE